MNFLEQLVSEWYQYQDYYVRTNVRVGKRKGGGYEGELDVVAFDPRTKNIVHLETAMDGAPWEMRRRIFGAKFEKGRRFIPDIFPFAAKDSLQQVAVLCWPRKMAKHEPLGPGIKIKLLTELIDEIALALSKAPIAIAVVPEGLPLLRAIQFALDYGGYLPKKKPKGAGKA